MIRLLARRWVPLVIIGALGALLWREAGRFFPIERAVSWSIPGEPSTVREIEIQLYSANADLVKRELLVYPRGLFGPVVQRVVARDGDYAAQLFVRRTTGVTTLRSELRLSGSDEVQVALKSGEN